MYIPANAHALVVKNAKSEPWVAQAIEKNLNAVKPWREMSYDELWLLLFSHTIPRSWSVWSNGHCPICKKLVPMYNWVIDPFKHPWKLACPHCKELFPKNDYAAYYESGLDQQNIFRFEKADASLLFNSEHPDPADPLHKFCVDDGHGVPTPPGHNDNLWRFVGTYLIYGRWKWQILRGISALSNAYVVGGDIDDARRCAILLHRVGDLYSSFDHKTQSVVEEKYFTDGFVSTWHDACVETRDMALSYDVIRDAVRNDPFVSNFLAEKSKKHALGNSFGPGDVCAHIEDGVFRAAIREPHKIHTNYPGRDVTIMLMLNILGTAADKQVADGMLDNMLSISTQVDGVTGEKGLNGYTGFVLVYLGGYLAYAERSEPGAIKRMLARHPRLRGTFRFHIDTWCLQQNYYPSCGDAGHFAAKDQHYQAIRMDGHAGFPTTAPSPSEFLWNLYEATGDEAYVQLLYHGNGGKLDGLPFNLFATDAAKFREKVAGVIAKHGPQIKLGNTLKDEWHLAILRSGEGDEERAAWMQYDTGGAHAHANCMNIGLFAKGLDLMPDMGYPTLQFDGFGVHFTQWYIESWSHNTVIIDGKNQDKPWSYVVGNPATLWADGKRFAAVRASCPESGLGSEPRVSSVVPIPAPQLAYVGLYFHTEASATRIRVYTKPIGAPQGESNWTLMFEDRFDRAELGPDWEVVQGEWRIENGKLVGHGHLGCMRMFEGSQRIEFEASSNAETLCDLSAVLATVPSSPTFRTGAFLGFGSTNNTCAKFSSFGRPVIKSDAPETKIQRGKSHVIRAEIDGSRWRLSADGKQILEYHNTAETIERSNALIRKGRQFERTWARIDLSATDSYYLDVFRVTGGHDHAKFQHSHFGEVTTTGLALSPTEDFYNCKLMRGFTTDKKASPGWTAEWHARDDYHYLPAGKEVYMRYIDMTPNAAASTCEAWVVRGSYNSVDETWIKRLMVRRQNAADGPALESTFVSLVEPHEGKSQIASVRRLPLVNAAGVSFGEVHVCLEVTLIDGRRDILVSMDVENPLEKTPAFKAGEVVSQHEVGLELSGELAWVRLSREGKVEGMSLSNGTFVRCAGGELKMPSGKKFVEVGG